MTQTPPLALRRELAARRRLRTWGATVAAAAFLLALTWALAAAGASVSPSLLLSPGLLVPLGLLGAAVAAVVLLRRLLALREIRLEGELLLARPGLLARLVQATSPTRVAMTDVRQIRLLATRDGTRLALFPGEADSPTLVELARADISRLLDALDAAPEDAWHPEARAATQDLRRHGDLLLAPPSPGGGGDTLPEGGPSRVELAATLRAAGLWHLAADLLWPEVLTHPEDLGLALSLFRGERCRLPAVTRLALLQALLPHHPRSGELLLDYARVCMALRNRKEASAALDRLVLLEDHPPIGDRWRAVLRERRQLPAPPSKATFGVEVSLPSHHLEGRELLVDRRYRVPLDLFVGYRLLPGFWGPPRRLQLVDTWGANHLLLGDPLDWAARLERAAPHLCEVHDEGLLWPGTGRRIRRLRRLPTQGD